MNEDFLDKVKLEGYRLTRQRQAALDVMKEAKGDHLSCEEIFERLKAKGEAISLATVYRALPFLEKMGFARKVFINDGYKYEPVQEESPRHAHHHLVCVECGAVIEIHEDFLEELEMKIEHETGFIVANHNLQFTGHCKECLERAAERESRH